MNKSMQRGGAEVLLVQQANALREIGHDVDVLYDSGHKGPMSSELRAAGCRVTGLRNLHLHPFELLSRARGYCIVHTHSPLPAATFRLALRMGRQPPGIVHTEHNVWSAYHPFTRMANRLTFSLVDRSVAVSNVAEQSMSFPARRRTTVVHHGVDLDAIEKRGTDGTGRLRQLLDLALRTPVVGTIANLRPEKDYPNLLRSAAHVLQRRPEVVFVSIGHGPLMDEIATMARSLGIADNVHMLGERDDALELIADVDVFVLASRFEGLPIALMEAMALERPVVATAAGGVPEVLHHRETGLLVPTSSPVQLGDALLTLLHDQELAETLAAAARRSMEQVSPKSAAQRILRVYQGVCSIHRRA